MSDSRVTREYKLHGLSELIHLDKSCNCVMGDNYRSIPNMVERMHFQSSKDYKHGMLCMACISLNMLV